MLSKEMLAINQRDDKIYYENIIWLLRIFSPTTRVLNWMDNDIVDFMNPLELFYHCVYLESFLCWSLGAATQF